MVWSFCDHSNLTNTVQDALAMGKLVVTLDDGSLKDYLTNINYSNILLIPKYNFINKGVEIVGNIIKEGKFYLNEKKFLLYSLHMGR